MKKKLLLLALVVVVTFAFNASVFAATTSPTPGKVEKLWDDLQQIKKSKKDALLEITLNVPTPAQPKNDYWYGNDEQGYAINLVSSQSFYLIQDAKTALSIKGAPHINLRRVKDKPVKEAVVIIPNAEIENWVKKVDLTAISADKKLHATSTIVAEAKDVVKPGKSALPSAKVSALPSVKASVSPSPCKTSSVSPASSEDGETDEDESPSAIPTTNSKNNLPKTGQTDMITIPLIIGIVIVLTGSVLLIVKKRKSIVNR